MSSGKRTFLHKKDAAELKDLNKFLFTRFYIQGLKFAYQRQNAWELVLLNTFLVSASTMLLWKFFQKLEAIEEVSEYKKLYIAVSILSLIACVVLCYLFQDAVLVGIVSNVFVPLIMSALAELLG